MAAAVRQLHDYFATHAARFGLDGQRLAIEPVFNEGGFVNASFRIADGRHRFHLKLAGNPEDLATYWTYAGLLTDRYRSPRAIAWVDVPALGSGILFEGVTSHPANDASLALATDLARLLEQLHGDTDLAARLAADGLGQDGQGQACAETYHDTFGRRFAEDLDMVAKDRPPFVTEAIVAFMRQEAQMLREIVDRHPAFTAATASPIHSDIWSNNVLVEPDGHWRLIDWDDLGIGDPALDIAMLLEFAGGDGARCVAPDELGLDLSAAMRVRTRVYRRASRLDWAIDSLADWLEAGTHPAWTERARAQKQADYTTALARYRATYSRQPQADLADR